MLLTPVDSRVFRVSEGGEGFVVLAVMGLRENPKKLGLWVLHVMGRVDGGPKERLARMRGLMIAIEQMGRNMGCDELRIEGRMKWARLFPELEQTMCGDVPTLRKVLK